jgi:hypothetical protein
MLLSYQRQYDIIEQQINLTAVITSLINAKLIEMTSCSFCAR